MRPQAKLTDQQFIDRVRWQQHHRRKLGALCAVIGIAGWIVLQYFVSALRQQSQDTLDATLPRGRSPSEQSLATSVDQVRHTSSFVLGCVCGVGFMSMGSMVATGAALLLSKSRKDTLLLNCWDGDAGACRTNIRD
jgi:hypothetical protein